MDKAEPSAAGGVRRFRRFVTFYFLSALMVALFLFADTYTSGGAALEGQAHLAYQLLPLAGFAGYFVYLLIYFLINRYQWKNKVMGGITSDEPELAATSLMISFRRYAKTKRHYQIGLLISLLAFYCAYLSFRKFPPDAQYIALGELVAGFLILAIAYVIGRYFKPAEAFMAKFIRMFYSVPAAEPMYETEINRHVKEKIDNIKRNHPSWFGK